MRFSSICPLWTDIIKNYHTFNYNTRAQIVFNIKDEARCVVGEAYGFSNEYARVGAPKYCRECHYYGMCFAYSINGDRHVLDLAMFREKARLFRKHFEKYHLITPLVVRRQSPRRS